MCSDSVTKVYIMIGFYFFQLSFCHLQYTHVYTVERKPRKCLQNSHRYDLSSLTLTALSSFKNSYMYIYSTCIVITTHYGSILLALVLDNILD